MAALIIVPIVIFVIVPYTVISAFWYSESKEDVKRYLEWAKEYKEKAENDTYGVYKEGYESYLSDLVHSRYLLSFWYKWPLYFLKRNDTTVSEADDFLNEVAGDRLIKQLDDTLEEIEKKKALDAKAVEAKAKLDLLKKEMT